MSKTLKIAEGLDLPLSVVTQKLAFIGLTGSGKTYAATKLAELMLDAHAQVIALDVVGTWYGLRLGRDGKSAGYPIPVIGGLHGDVPLEPSAGALIADLIIDRDLSAVVDISQFITSEQIRFGTDFAARFFWRRKSKPAACHLFLEECQEMIPQNISGLDKTAAKMLNVFSRLVKIGRNYGIGASFLTQRPQEVQKKCLNLSSYLFCFKLVGAHERAAIRDWVRGKGFEGDIDTTLQGLKEGYAHLWAPEFESSSIRVLPKKTYDASATPEVGVKAVEPRKLTPIDIAALEASMAETVERQKAEDPAHLKRQVAELKRKLAAAEKQTPIPDAAAIETAVKDTERAWAQKLAGVADMTDELLVRLADIRGRVGSVEALREKLEGLKIPVSANGHKPAARAPVERKPMVAARPPVRVLSEAAGELSGPEKRILNAIAWCESIGIAEPEQTAVAFLAGYTYGGGGFNNPRGSLRTKGLVDYRGSCIALTDDGRAFAEVPAAPLTTEEMHRRVMEILPGPERKVLTPLLYAYPKDMGNEQLAQESGYTAGSGGFNNPKGRLRSLGLIEYPTSGRARARDILFVD
jgi:hypothetical protein